MRIGTRLWIFGAFLPVAGLVAALFFAGYYFQVELERQLDQALLTEGSPIADPLRFTKLVSELMVSAGTGKAA